MELSTLTDADKERRAVWFLAVAVAGYFLDKGVITSIHIATVAVPSPFGFSTYAIRGLLRICIAFGFISYLSVWRFSSGNDTVTLIVFRRAIYPVITVYVPLIAVARLSASPVNWFAVMEKPHVFIPLLLLLAVLALSSKAFSELRVGSDNMRHRFSQAYSSLLFANTPPKSRSDLWLMDFMMLAVVIVVAFIPV